MIEIFVCEDDRKQREQLNSYISNYIMMEALDMKLGLSTHDPIALIDHVKNSAKKGLYFLDVNLEHEMSGIILGAEIRKYDPEGTIVFITTHAELTYLTFVYKVEALDYIIKNDFENIQQRVIDCIKIVQERAVISGRNNVERFQVQVGDKVINENIQDILFFETSTVLHKLMMHTKTRSVEFYGRMKDIADKHSLFYRCHNSFVINVKNIEEIERKSRKVLMKNGAACYASIRHMKGLLDICEEYNIPVNKQDNKLIVK